MFVISKNACPWRAFPGPHAIKLFTSVIYEFCNKPECLSPGKLFRLSLMFAGKLRAYPSEAPFKCSTLGQAPGITCKHYTKLEKLDVYTKSTIRGFCQPN